jgi:hypothetical protein
LQHNGPVDARNPSDFSREVTVDEDDAEDAEEAEADVEPSIDDSVSHDSGRSGRVRDIEPINVDTSPPGDNTTSTAVSSFSVSYNSLERTIPINHRSAILQLS